MKQYCNNYLGIVVQNNDPEQRGRIKIWVPFISAVITEKWNKQKKNKKFKFPGKNLSSDLTVDIMDELKQVLPWAEYCAPAIGATGSGKYNAFDDTTTISDASTTATPVTDSVLAKYKLNSEGSGEKPGKLYEAKDSRILDAFIDTAASQSKYINRYGSNYAPSNYSNAAKGSFSIPNVGSHVWIFFREGNPQFPVYFGASFGQEDFRGIYNDDGTIAQDYPQSSENKSKSDISSATVDTNIYRNKYVFNQKGGTIEIINTDNREAFNLTHYSGSFLGFNNKTTTLFASNNFQSLTLGNAFETFRRNKSLYVAADRDTIIKGDELTKIGSLNLTALQNWYNTYKQIHDLKKLFEIQRVEQSGSFATISHLGNNIQSFSTQDGTWSTQTSKNNIVDLIKNNTATLADIEASMEHGGNSIQTIYKHKIEVIGLLLNDYDSYRVDMVGKLSEYATTIASTGVYAEKAASPLVEYVDAENYPVGSFTQVIANKYKAIVGSGGYEMKTTGPIDFSGTIVNLAGNQLNIAAKNELTIDGGKRLNLVADIITLSQRAGKQVNIPTNFGVGKNAVIRGGAHVEGELSVQHITAPLEFQITEPVHIKSTFIIRNMKTTGIQQIGDSGSLNQNITDGILEGELEILVDHTHYFRNLPLKLVDGNTAVRDDCKDAVNADSTTPRVPYDIIDEHKASFHPVMLGPDNGPPPNS